MESITCQNCKKPLSEEILEKEMPCPNCGSELRRDSLKVETGHIKSTGYDTSPAIIRTVYMKYYHLANEMAHKCNSCEDRSEIVKYSLGTVQLSYTTIDCFVNTQVVVNNDLKKIKESLTNDEKHRFFDHGLIERIEKLYNELHHPNELDKGSPEIQPLKILRDLRVQAIHYKPFRESDEADWKKSIIDIINDSNRKFDLAEDEREFLNKVYSVGCANWAFNLIEEILNWFCDNFDIEQQTFNPKYEIK